MKIPVEELRSYTETDGRTDMRKVIGAFRAYANVPENVLKDSGIYVNAATALSFKTYASSLDRV
jgi:hypothetical protein